MDFSEGHPSVSGVRLESQQPNMGPSLSAAARPAESGPCSHAQHTVVRARTAKCDFCGCRNSSSAMMRCTKCSWHTCEPCAKDRGWEFRKMNGREEILHRVVPGPSEPVQRDSSPTTRQETQRRIRPGTLTRAPTELLTNSRDVRQDAAPKDTQRTAVQQPPHGRKLQSQTPPTGDTAQQTASQTPSLETRRSSFPEPWGRARESSNNNDVQKKDTASQKQRVGHETETPNEFQAQKPAGFTGQTLADLNNTTTDVRNCTPDSEMMEAAHILLAIHTEARVIIRHQAEIMGARLVAAHVETLASERSAERAQRDTDVEMSDVSTNTL